MEYTCKQIEFIHHIKIIFERTLIAFVKKYIYVFKLYDLMIFHDMVHDYVLFCFIIDHSFIILTRFNETTVFERECNYIFY